MVHDISNSQVMFRTKICYQKKKSTGKKVSSTGVEMRNIFYLCHIRYVYAFLITGIDHGNSELVGSELELFETLESSRIFKKIEEIFIIVVLGI